MSQQSPESCVEVDSELSLPSTSKGAGLRKVDRLRIAGVVAPSLRQQADTPKHARLVKVVGVDGEVTEKPLGDWQKGFFAAHAIEVDTQPGIQRAYFQCVTCATVFQRHSARGNNLQKYCGKECRRVASDKRRSTRCACGSLKRAASKQCTVCVREGGIKAEICGGCGRANYGSTWARLRNNTKSPLRCLSCRGLDLSAKKASVPPCVTCGAPRSLGSERIRLHYNREREPMCLKCAARLKRIEVPPCATCGHARSRASEISRRSKSPQTIPRCQACDIAARKKAVLERTICKRGHTLANVGVYRSKNTLVCKECHRLQGLRNRAEKKAGKK